MDPIGEGLFAQGRSCSRPPLFCGTNFSHWKTLMKMFVIDQDMELWEIITKGPKIPMKKDVHENDVIKSESEYSQTDLEWVSKNYRAMNQLCCALNGTEFNRVSSCTSAKEIWDKLVVTYEGTSQVKETKINILMHQYEMFKMKKDENINEMFTRFTLITNSLNSLGKTFTNAEKVQKVLRCLPRSKWGPKVTAIEEAQDLRVLSLDDLLGKLTTHELTLHDDGDNDVIPSMKNLALKAKKHHESSSDSEDSDDEEDPFALITKGLEGIMKMRKRFKKFKSRNKGKSSNSNSNFKTNKLACFECGSTEHIVKDCPKKKRQSYKKNKNKQAMVATWSDSEVSSESENEDGQAHICLMADNDDNDDLDQNHKEVREYLNTCTKDELIITLLNMFQIEKILKDEKNILEDRIRHYAEGCEEIINKNNSLKAEKSNLEKTVKVLKEQNLSQTKQLIDLKNENNDLEARIKTLKLESEKNLQALNKLNESESKLTKMLTQQKSTSDKRGIGYNHVTHNYKSKTTFVKGANKHKRTPTCTFCCKKGHIRFACPYRRKDDYIIKNSFPFELREQIKQIWVPKGTRPPNMVYPEYGSKFVTWIAK